MAYIDNLHTFIRVYDLGSMSAAARDLRISAAVASARISQLEDHLGTRLFLRTTRSLSPTEQGDLFYPGAKRVIEAISDAEADVLNVTGTPRGTLHIAAPLGMGQRLIAPAFPAFQALYPDIRLRLRLSDRHLDLTSEGLDAAFILERPADSSLTMRSIANCPRLLCASPDYLAQKGAPETPEALETHDCLNLRYPGVTEFQWTLETKSGLRRFDVSGPFETDHGDVLTQWALAGMGIILKPRFEVAEHLASGALLPVLPDTPPLPVKIACLFAHKKNQDPKARLFIDFMVRHIQNNLKEIGAIETA